jgi:hypothetical protein
MTGKSFMVENLRLLFQDVHTVQIDRYGSLHTWIHEALNEKYWCQLVDQLLHPSTPLPDRPAKWGPLPSWQAQRTAADQPPTDDIPDSDNKTSTDKDNEQPRAPPQPPLPSTVTPPCCRDLLQTKTMAEQPCLLLHGQPKHVPLV